MVSGNRIIMVLPTTTDRVTCKRIRSFCSSTLMLNIVPEVWLLQSDQSVTARAKVVRWERGRGEISSVRLNFCLVSNCSSLLSGLQRLPERGARSCTAPIHSKAARQRFLVQLTDVYIINEAGCFPRLKVRIGSYVRSMYKLYMHARVCMSCLFLYGALKRTSTFS